MSNGYSFYKIFEKSCARHYDDTAIIYYKNGRYCEYLYSEAFGVCEYLFQQLQILGFSCGHVGLYMSHNPLIPSLIAAIHKSGSAFMFLDPQLPVSDTQKILHQMNFQIIVSIDVSKDVPKNRAGFHMEKLISLYGFYVGFYKTQKTKCSFKSDFSYTIRTSGSTGDPKIIHVPHDCLKPNIEDLQKLFQSGISDIIMFSTPLTFDPSVIEIYLAATSGSSLLIAPEDASIMFPSGENAKYSVTIWQTTPSKLLQHSDFNISHFILGETSSLRILALGGEPLSNVERLKMLKHDNNKTQLHCLYGVTEMSCWACATQVKLKTMKEKEEIPVGKCLSRTHIKICKDDEDTNVGRILLGSDIRKCVRADDDCHSQATKDGILWVETGDLGEIKNNLIYYRGRIDDMVKRFGNKINLHHIEKVASQFPNIKNVCAVWLPNLHFVTVCFVSDIVTTNDLKLYLASRLDNLHQPDRIFKIKNLPLNTHGKVAKQPLMETTLKQLLKGKSKRTLVEMFLAELQDVISGIFTYESIKDNSFFDIGGNSITALTVANRLKHLYKDSIPTFLPHLLDNSRTIEQIVDILKESLTKVHQPTIEKSTTKRKIKLLKSSKILKINDTSLQMGNTNESSFKICWSINMDKCVDAIPTIFPSDAGIWVCIGSHSGKIIVTNEHGSIKCSFETNSRIEAPILCFNSKEIGHAGVVGTHNGTVCCFTLDNCELIWQVNISCMIKSQALFHNEHIYIASYDGNIRSLKGKDGTIVKIINISKCGITSDLEITTDNKYIATATLDGICACVNTSNHTIEWQIKVGSPVFAKPVIFNQNNFILFAEVYGVVHCIKLETGEMLWTYSQVNGHLFTSFLVDHENNVGWRIIFGCHDEHVHCLKWSDNDSPSLLWKKKLVGSIYSTPCKIYEDGVVLVSSRGQLYILDITSGNVEYEFQFPNEVFSSPKVYGEHIFIGCRDDNLYGLTHSKVNKKF